MYSNLYFNGYETVAHVPAGYLACGLWAWRHANDRVISRTLILHIHILYGSSLDHIAIRQPIRSTTPRYHGQAIYPSNLIHDIMFYVFTSYLEDFIKFGN